MQPRSDQDSSVLAEGPLTISTDRHGDSVTIALLGELDLASADELDRAIGDCEDTEIGEIVVDLTGVSFIDSSGLSTLLRARRRLEDRLRFVPSEHEAVTRLLVMTKTDEILD